MTNLNINSNKKVNNIVENLKKKSLSVVSNESVLDIVKCEIDDKEIILNHETLLNSTDLEIKELLTKQEFVQTEMFEKVKKSKNINPNSKQQLSFQYYKSNPNMTRKEFMNYCMNVLTLTKDGSSTYYVNVRKMLRNELSQVV